MKKRIVLLFIFILVIACIPVSAASPTQKAPTIQLSHSTKIVHSAKKNYVTGKISAANGQRVVLYNAKGKAISLQRMGTTGLSQSFKLPAPKLKKGKTIFVVRAESIDNIPASNAAMITLHYKKVDKPKDTSSASTGAAGAVAWALKIAEDDSFTYGNKPATSRVGCYFCGTNKRNKPKGYEKTYVCMTFVHAAYAHGAGDPEMLKDCQGGTHCISLNESNFTSYSCWKKVGLCSELTVKDLLPGDVIIWYAANDKDGHASLYAGNGDIVDASSPGFTAKSISLKKGKAKSYLRRGARHSSKSFVMRYIGPQKKK